jgi:hypothetical protein
MMPRPDILKKMMEAISQIDLQIRTRQLEKEGYHRPQNYQHHQGRYQVNISYQRTKDRDDDVIMQMNTTLTKEEKDKLIKKKACFNYRIPEYFTNKCQKPKKS